MTIKFCQQCAALLTQKTVTQYDCPNGHSSWNNPHAAVTVAIVKDDQILFSKRAAEPNKGKYDMPGGFMEYGEDPIAAVKRETMEETGLTIHSLELIGASTHEYEPNSSTTDLIYVCKNWSGEPVAQDDVAELAWKPVEFIDSDEFAWEYPELSEKISHFLK